MRKCKTGPNDTATRYSVVFSGTSNKPVFVTALRLAKKALK